MNQMATEPARDSNREVSHPQFVAGADAAFDLDANRIYAAVVILRFPRLELVETAVRTAPLSFPYIPGLLSFRGNQMRTGFGFRMRSVGRRSQR